MTDPEKQSLMFFSTEGSEEEEGQAPASKFNRPYARKLAVELIGTYVLTLTVAMSGTVVGPGFVLAGLVYAFGHISGGHFNPAITIGLSGANKMDGFTALSYAVAQTLGAFLAGAQHNAVAGEIGMELSYPSITDGVTAGSALLTELSMTMVLVIVFLNVTSTKAQEKNQFFGTAIGFALAAASQTAAPVSDGCLNPAIGIALPAVAGHFDDIWLYVLGPCLGGCLAAIVFALTVDPVVEKAKTI